MEPHPDFPRRGDLGAPQVTAAPGRDVQVVRRRGAPAEQQLREAHPRRQVRGLLVDLGPQRVQRGQPGEQRAVDRRTVRPREVLVDVMVRVHQTGRHQAPGGVKHLQGRRLGVSGRTHPGHEPAGDGHPPPGQLPPVSVTGSDQLGVAHQQISLRSRHHAPKKSKSRSTPPRRTNACSALTPHAKPKHRSGTVPGDVRSSC